MEAGLSRNATASDATIADESVFSGRGSQHRNGHLDGRICDCDSFGGATTVSKASPVADYQRRKRRSGLIAGAVFATGLLVVAQNAKAQQPTAESSPSDVIKELEALKKRIAELLNSGSQQ